VYERQLENLLVDHVTTKQDLEQSKQEIRNLRRQLDHAQYQIVTLLNNATEEY